MTRVGAALHIAPNESHDAVRQRLLRAHAVERAAVIAQDRAVVGVLLTGSVARGPVGPASDVDLHVIVAGKNQLDIPVWRFVDAQIIENIHVVEKSELLRGLACIGDSNQLASWFHHTTLAEFLYGFEDIYWRDPHDPFQRGICALVELRQDPCVVQKLVAAHSIEARQYVKGAHEALRCGAVMDGHQLLRDAAQRLLVAALIRVGWMIRGSKNRPEVAETYADDRLVAASLGLLEEIVGFRGVTVEHVRAICALRLDLRQIIVDELKAQISHPGAVPTASRRLLEELQLQTHHNAGSFDYYDPLVSTGFLKGVLNHIRSLSGFSRVPARLMSCLEPGAAWPIDRFGSCSRLSPAIRALWFRIADLDGNPEHVWRWATALEELIFDANPELTDSAAALTSSSGPRR